jgi:hypothetical protein
VGDPVRPKDGRGHDLDALLSSVLAHHLFGWDIAGYYDLRTIWRSSTGGDDKALREAVWLDLDICRPNLKSIGHHILTINGQTPAPPQHARTLNPNLLRGVGMNPVTSWRRKYPLGTLHFLLWLWNADLPPGRHESALPLVWLADSAYINGQSDTPAARRYRTNVLDWARNAVPSPVLTASLDEIDTDAFEERVERLRPILEGCGWAWGQGNIRSRHRYLSGGQCRFNQPNPHRLNALYDAVARYHRLARAPLPRPFRSARRNTHPRPPSRRSGRPNQ